MRRLDQDIASSAGVTRGPCTTTSAVARRSTSGCSSDSAPSASKTSGRRQVAALVRAWRIGVTLAGRTDANRTIWLATMAHGEDIADLEVRRAVGDLVRRAVALLTAYHADIAEDSPRLRYALECWTGSTAPRHDAGWTARPPVRRRTSCSPRRSSTSCAFGAPPARHGAHRLPETSTIELHARQGPGRQRAKAPVSSALAQTLRPPASGAAFARQGALGLRGSVGPCSAPIRRGSIKRPDSSVGAEARIWHDCRMSA